MFVHILVGGLWIVVITLFLLIYLLWKESKKSCDLQIESNDLVMNYASTRINTLRGEMLDSKDTKDALIVVLTQKVKAYAGESLLHYMKELSENFFCSGWEGGLEYKLWKTVVEEIPVNEEDPERAKSIQLTLKYLSQDAGGWWINGSEFVPMNKWVEMYEKKFPAN